ncbi:MAG: SBBP repeat-containing protein [Fluviicola sp.]|nr:SBBP repeat-containing protein [Fluviicola sp.]
MKNYRIKHFGLGLVFIISFFQNFQAQTFDWAKSQGGTSSDIALDVVTDAAGNVYTVGYFSGTVDFDPSGVTQNLVSAGAQDIFVSKLNATGALVWVLRFGAANNDVANGIALDPSGNILITGWFNSIVDFDPGAGVVTLNNTSGSDIYVLKLTTNGNFVWVKQFGGNVENQVGNKITTDAAGNVYSTGQSKAVIDFDPGPGTANLGVAGTSPSFYVSKLDVNGNYVWAKVMGTSGSLAYGLDIEVSSVGEVYSCGYFGGTIDFDPGVGTYSQTSSTNNGFVHKLDANGNFVWAKTVGGSSNNSFNSIVLAQDKIFVAGYFANTGDFDPGTSVVNMTADGGADVLVESFDFNGNYVWVKKLGGTAEDWAYSISTDGLGGIYTTGFFTASGDFDPGAGAATLSAVGLRDVFISKLDVYGNYHWAQQIGGTAIDQGFGIHVGPTGSVHTTGYYGATGDFDHTAGVSTLTNAGSNDVFTQKMSQCLTPPAPVNTTANMQTICTNSNIALSVSGFGTIGWYTDPTGGTYIGGGSTYTTPNLTATTTYYVQDSVCGPSSRTPITVTVNALPTTPTITAGGPTSICAGGSVTLTSTAGTSYLWSTGATTASINVTTAGI